MSEGKQIKRSVFFISDGTAITAETLGHSLLAQFPHVDFDIHIIPYISSEEAAMNVVAEINQRADQDGQQPLVFDTLVDPYVRDIINTANAVNLDVFEGLIGKLSEVLGTAPTTLVGQTHAVTDSESYKARIDAVHFALDNDDGARTRHYDKADLILIGVSRSGKTPTSIYLSLQFGIRVANYPLTEEDLDDNRLPAVLRAHKHKLFGLMIDAERLVAIRTERKANSRYASFSQCQMELRAVEGIYISEGIKYLNVSEMSIEEISTRVLQMTGLKRRIG
ncbi:MULTISPECIES: pyruvate, water dikinase regulatory protein [unclassified Acinetobacter]|jgi:regulator of PEP synthase PpsR (kinase-PPPase family)|uniref:posphoenolpyruvate synthetase regulatory kinase/phosphorylase PpsR n=1 Tax=unclassified Acinetobacter TaxID=196816 RepID=UPI000A3552B1|nr:MULTISPECIES: pyruvate, water dikinase regulatory protein [unclassified Acinetobacter]MCG2608316.1 kinase/pyrophosphorylase [Acinetobacter sp. SM34]MDN5525902.1 kinase/pyrophosphorylase [Acinetobacter sp.]MDN5542348.1 kinase/pyrophosphorylase [Acinetobacter sp.]OTG62768.1 phosphoenolpyruvate synthase regulatory protein [Acinetobacter sp. ANC 3903]